jgi:hypothetical protein
MLKDWPENADVDTMVRTGKKRTFSFRLSSKDSQSMKNKSRTRKPASRKPSGSGELRRDAEEVALLEGRWKILGDATPPTIRPKKYQYIDELVRLQFELLKMQEWVRLQA